MKQFIEVKIMKEREKEKTKRGKNHRRERKEKEFEKQGEIITTKKRASLNQGYIARYQ